VYFSASSASLSGNFRTEGTIFTVNTPYIHWIFT